MVVTFRCADEDVDINSRMITIQSKLLRWLYRQIVFCNLIHQIKRYIMFRSVGSHDRPLDPAAFLLLWPGISEPVGLGGPSPQRFFGLDHFII